jgi:hypothetical protein
MDPSRWRRKASGRGSARDPRRYLVQTRRRHDITGFKARGADREILIERSSTENGCDAGTELEDCRLGPSPKLLRNPVWSSVTDLDVWSIDFARPLGTRSSTGNRCWTASRQRRRRCANNVFKKSRNSLSGVSWPSAKGFYRTSHSYRKSITSIPPSLIDCHSWPGRKACQSRVVTDQNV